MEPNKSFIVRVATPDDKKYATLITDEMASSAEKRGTGIARRSPEYIMQKMEEGKAVIALTPSEEWVGFCYIEAWGHDKFVANSGLIVAPPYRGQGVATAIKKEIFRLSRRRYPDAKIFGLTTGLSVMKINSELGYEPVTYSELTDDEAFWKGCQSCVNYDVLMSKGRKNCFCTAMLYDPAEKEKQPPVKPEPKVVVTSSGHLHKKKKRHFAGNFRLFERWIRYKRHILLKSAKKKEDPPQGGSGAGKKKFFLFNIF
ncbi:GNAT family N-acetyltransferase [Compostibacter hankyongensis]|uniref:N-acetyltransferase domain-containing protein n=1 Tax=Compostibacter hankyongensis TaxID=1007089 RepID=A0ABP8FJ51_9BACT